MLRICALFVLLFASPLGAVDAQFSGSIHVIDGDTFDIGSRRVRLHGVDAVEKNQTCRTEQGQKWACGLWVVSAVRAQFEGANADCTALGTDRYNRTLARCSVGGDDLGATLVADGLVTAYARYSMDYVSLESKARATNRGLWASTSQSPESFRHAKQPVVSSDCMIKGNISTKNARIFHVPGQQDYEKTRINTAKGERWFCSAAEARAAGWRPAAR